jgi:6-pyruvoyltetrahydropterin/6-carboxytetrahydropterin synthase
MKLRIAGDKLTIASAHMLSKHDKCARLHGHNYNVEIEIEGELDENNMVIDFAIFKAEVAKILKELDHKILVPTKNHEFKIDIEKKQVSVLTSERRFYRFPREDVVLLPLESTTVELLSKYVHSKIESLYPQFKITVMMSETPTSIVIYSGE